MPGVQIRYCKIWNYYPRAARVAAQIKEGTSADVEVIEGARGEFSVRVGDRVVAQKSSRGFPSDDEIVAEVRAALQQ